MNDMKTNKVNDVEHKLERLGKLLEENAILNEKLSESEIYRKKFMEKNNETKRNLLAISSKDCFCYFIKVDLKNNI